MAVPFSKQTQLVDDSVQFTLPAQIKFRGRRTHANTVIPAYEPDKYYYYRLSTADLEVVHSSLWLAGLRDNTRTLHRQVLLNRKLVVVEQADLHLCWTSGRLLLMPLPTELLNFDEFNRLFGNAGQAANSHADAVGLLKSYSQLIVFESDLQIAQEAGLLAKSITYRQWVAFVTDIMDYCSKHPDSWSSRWDFGELRISRLNLIYQLHPHLKARNVIRAYFRHSESYGQYVQENFAWMFTLFAFISIVLSAFQVGVGTPQASDWDPYNGIAWVFSNLSLVLAVVAVASVLAILLVLVPVNVSYAWRSERAARRGPSKGSV